MTQSLGDFDASAIIYGKFTTYRPSTGAAFTLGGTPALSVYKDNSVTQSTTGVTLTADFDSVTGLNHYAIDTSADGTFYAAGSFFDIVITTGTVDSVSVVGAVVGSFTVRKNSALKPTTAGRTLVVDAAGLGDANMVKAGPTGSGTAQTAGDIPARLPAALTANGNMKSSMVEILTTALTETAGLLAGGFKKFFNIATPAATMDHGVLVDTVTTTTTATTATNLTNAPTAGDFTAAMKTSLNAATPASVVGAVGSVTGAVGSVTGAVGSVTGNVGGNVVGSVASVTARVTANTDQINSNATAAATLATSLNTVATGTCAALGTTTSVISSALSPSGAVADQFKNRVLIFSDTTTTTALQGQATNITASTNAATPTFTVTALTTAPVNGDVFIIV